MLRTGPKAAACLLALSCSLALATGPAQTRGGAAAPALDAVPGLQTLLAESGGSARARLSPAIGRVRHLELAPGRPRLAGRTPEERALDFFRRYGEIVGVRDAHSELGDPELRRDSLGTSQLRYLQTYRGLPVFGAELRVHFDRDGQIRLVHGTVIPDLTVDPVPSRIAEEAGATAVAHVRAEVPGASGSAIVAQRSRLLIFRTGLLRRVPGTDHLAWEVEVADGGAVREFVYVDAATGKVLDRISGIHTAMTRRVHEPQLNQFLIWDEGDPLPYATGDPAGDGQVNTVIDVTANVYNVYSNLSGGAHLSWNGVDGVMESVWNIPPAGICPNAYWDGVSTNFCYGIAGDDTVAHEWTHAYTEATHGLIYQWQSGALNEGWSDIFGELIDLINGTGLDAPAGARTAGGCSTLGGRPAPTLTISAPAAIAGTQSGGGGAFNPAGPLTATGSVLLVNDGMGTPTDACSALVGFVAGRIALVDRGNCPYPTKAQNVQNAGAIGMIVVNVSNNYTFNMSGGAAGITIPSIMIGDGKGNEIKAQLGVGVTASVSVTPSTDGSLRFLSGEDDPSFGGAIRDMWNPTCYGDPGKVSDSAFYVCDTLDGGGVHTNSGIPNHAFALLLDGGTYNGQTISPLGPTRVAHLYWRAMSVYQVPDTDFVDHADALEQSCTDLVGVPLTDPLTGLPSGVSLSTADCIEVQQAMLAVEMRTPPSFCNFQPLLAPNAPPASCGSTPFLADFESDPQASWTRSNFGVYAEYQPRDWIWTADVPTGGTGSAIFALDSPIVGNCSPGSDDQSGVMRLDSPVIVLDNDYPLLTFDHSVATEPGYDGGNLSISVNGGPFTLVPGGVFSFNPYNTTLQSAPGNTNPMAGQPAFSGSDGGSNSSAWGQSQVDLTTYAASLETIRLRLELGVDGCNGVEGWYVDNVRVCGNCAGAGSADGDGDGVRNCDGDCDDFSADTHPGAPEVNDGIDNQCPQGAGFGLVDEISGIATFADPADSTRYSWPAQGGATSYQIARGNAPGFGTGCTTFTTASAFLLDPATPASRGAFYYLVRPFAPFAGSFGASSAGVARSIPCAP